MRIVNYIKSKQWFEQSVIYFTLRGFRF
ncbi:unnamed protein product [Acanthoscelides obtectus]|uniref:Uncharacterized protein n=1 Tax=Acanthoscelides obtectus TaxID=200917 RepID=A0A9P0K912_ACAOB|nr:unnamed protein product [Acanthoscelides obtectus]CAK1651927.1 hypothetical protein AOBTE_LOCUS17549 [Acanthoscelides obtectus]